MSLPSNASPLVYVQDETFVSAVGEPLPPAAIRRIVVGKWDALYAEGLRLACSQAFPESPVQICRRGEELLRCLRERPADFAVLGLTYVDLDGVDVLQAIGKERLAKRVMVISSRQDEHSLQALRVARFDGFFDPFEETVESLVVALQQVAAGRGYISLSIRRQIVTGRTAGVLAPRLSPAELQVFCVIGDGTEDAKAAERLGISIATVQTHRRNVMRKLGITTSAKLVREAVRLGVVRIQPDGGTLRPGFEELVAQRQERRARSR
jgi:DNA-binding NarL/FixJ family response regulator